MIGELGNEVLKSINAIEKSGIFELSESSIQKLEAILNSGEFPQLKFCKNKKDDTLFLIYDVSDWTKFTTIKMVKDAKEKKQKRNVGPTSRKEVENLYVLKYETEKSGYQENTNIATCKTLKILIKELRKEKIVSLEIYKMGINYNDDKTDIIATRRSAWV